MAATSFAKYLATQIYKGKMDEETVLNNFPKYADEIKKYLDDWNNQIPYIPDR